MKQPVDFLKLAAPLKTAKHTGEYSNLIRERLLEIPDIREHFRLSIEVTSLACNLVENLHRKRNLPGVKHIDKAEIVVSVLDGIFEYTALEKQTIHGQIEYLHQNGQIQQVSSTRICCENAVSLVLKIFLGL